MKVCFVYAAATGFSGQSFATKLLLENLPPSIERVAIPVPVWSGRLSGLPRYGWELCIAWTRIARETRQIPTFYINAGQSIFAIIRDGGCLLMACLANRNSKKVISFNGNLFALWARSSLKARLFTAMCNLGNIITVVGPNQKERLEKLGVCRRIDIVDNGSEMEALSPDLLDKKHEGKRLKVLFLGNLLETKGYTVFLEALAQLGTEGGIQIDATLAGDFVRDSHPVRFHSVKEAEGWILEMTREIHKSNNVRVEWIRGIGGSEKLETLRQAQALVFPSWYPVEAQPFVILEAMASGIAIIASRAGEIGTTLTPSTALFLDTISVSAVAQAIRNLQDGEIRMQLARNGLELFKARFTLSKYIAIWTRLICDR